MNRKSFWLIIISVLFSISCKTQPSQPKLVIVLVVDQMRPDLLTRFDKLYTGGFRWLIDHGIWYTNTHHEHSYTATGPGHFSIGSGQYPGAVGVLGNSFYDRNIKKYVNCVEDPSAKVIGADEGSARSYARYKTYGLGDWLKKSNPNSKVISVGGKDRAAIFLGGRRPDLPLYYNYAGSFISSDFYVDSLPDWVTRFNESLNAESYKDSLWTKSLKDDVYLTYAREDFYEGESDEFLSNEYSPVFPIGIDSTTDANAYFMGRPWFERELIKLAKEAIVNESLGKDRDPDILFVGFSAIDWMIHDYGPFSQEIMDAFIKLDRWLGNFIQDVDNLVGLENVQFILTADHGGLPLPEWVVAQGGTAGRIDKNHLKEAYEWIDEEIIERFGDTYYHRSGGNYFLDLDKLKSANIQPRKLFEIANKYLSKVNGIDRMIFKQDILESSDTDQLTQRLKNMIHSENSPEFFPLVTENFVYKYPHGTGHGTPYDYDTHVPLIFSNIYTQPSKRGNHQATVDIAPTIAKMLHVPIPEYCDGKPISL